VPKFSMEGALKSIEGNVPNLVTPPTGCRFHPRCPYAMEICRSEAPDLIEVERNHTVACYPLKKATSVDTGKIGCHARAGVKPVNDGDNSRA